MNGLNELFGLDGRTAVVTGASAGLGVEFAEALAAAGARVAIMARRRERLEEVAARLRSEYGAEVLPVTVDLNNEEDRRRAFGEVEARLGPVYALVNNAGTAPTGAAERQWPKDWQASLDLNLSALFHCCLLAVESMRGGKEGRIINIASIFGHLGSSLFRVASYASAKGGVENLTRQLAVEWAGDGITVNAIAPAWFASEMTETSLTKEGIRESMGRACPMARIGKAGELKTACLFLASPSSSYVSGTVVAVDGGYSAW